MLFGVDIRGTNDADARWNLFLELRVYDGVRVDPWSDDRDTPTGLAEITCVFERTQHPTAARLGGVMIGNKKGVFQVVDYFPSEFRRHCRHRRNGRSDFMLL